MKIKSNLKISGRRRISDDDEFDKVIAWTLENKLGVNTVKTRENVFHRPHPKSTPASDIT